MTTGTGQEAMVVDATTIHDATALVAGCIAGTLVTVVTKGVTGATAMDPGPTAMAHQTAMVGATGEAMEAMGGAMVVGTLPGTVGVMVEATVAAATGLPAAATMSGRVLVVSVRVRVR